MRINKFFFKYLIYYPVIFIRGEWIWRFSRELNKSQFLSAEDIEKIQIEKLNKLLYHAKSFVPYYNDLPDSKITSIEQLHDLPFLEKSNLRYQNKNLLSKKRGLLSRSKTTGGSTGAPVTIRKDSAGMAKELAATWRGYGWAGIEVGDKQARFWGVPNERKDRWRAKLIDFVTNRIRFSAFSFSDYNLSEYTNLINKKRPVYFYGYVSMIRQISDYVVANRVSIKPNVKAIITTSEVLSEIDREVISRTFGSRVYNEYGCGEIGTIAHECEYGNMHVNQENMIVEVLKENEASFSGEGELVVTDLVNFSMPLIRYRIKDYGMLSKKACRCGRGLQILENISGREYDILVNSKGHKFHGEFFLYILEDVKKQGAVISGVQIIQNNERLVIKLNCSMDSFNMAKRYIYDRLISEFDSDCIVVFEKVNKIDREPSGKLRVIKREG
ncbi:phenylacetate--CoA ligase family protein [Marinobacter sp. V034]|uniref:phenylacetate--CoA ligase family protein n=1 Tax=Marinobacter sp. V034 TaxID=3459610 RepID=UPI0040439A04